MPSIPQSLLWISLVVLWLFVLVPMLISKRDAVRRTSDVALATRVLNSTTSGRLLKRGGPASGHRSDPDWRPSEEELDENFDDADYDDDEYEHDEEEDEPQKTVVLAAPVVEDAEPDYLDVDVIEEPSGALPVGESADELTLNFEEPEAVEENVDTAVYEIATDEYEDDEEPDGTDDEYEYIEDSSGLEAPEESDLRVADSMIAARRGRYDPAKAAVISARKYKFRKRMLAFMTLVMLGSAAAAYFAAPTDRAMGLVRLRRYRCGHAAVPRIPPPSDAHRGTAAPAQGAAGGAFASWCGEHRGPRHGPAPATPAPTWCGGVGDRRRGPGVRAPRIRARGPRVPPAEGGRAVVRRHVGRFLRQRIDW